jgi:glycosyltransferase involved in cell wall biosynthesis
MKICMVSEDYDPSVAGVGIHLQNLVRELVARGHQIIVLTSRKPGQPPVSTTPGLTIYRNASVNLSGFHHSITSAAAIGGILERHQIEIVHVHFLSLMAMQAVKAARRLGVKTIYTFHMSEEIFTSYLTWLPPLQRAVSRRILRFCNGCDMVTFASADRLKKYQSQGLVTASTTVGNAVAFGTRAAPPDAHRGPAFVILFVGRLSPEKNLAFVLRVFHAISARYPQAELWLIGQGPVGDDLKRQAAQLGIDTRVKFLGYIPNAELPAYYAKANVFVLASLFEIFPMVLIEAMQFAQPLAVSDGILSCHDFVDEGENGFIFDHTDENSLRRSLEALLDNPGLQARMSAASLAKAASFSLETVIAEHEALYRRVLAFTPR